jgi:hypothetical protein
VLKAAVIGGTALAAFAALPTVGLAQISSINSAVIVPRVFNDVPGATGSYSNTYPSSISLGESGVSQATGFADRDIWYFSNNGSTPYSFQNNDYFDAKFTVTVTATSNPNNKDMEGGFIFSNPSGTFGGDDQIVIVQTSTGGPVFQSGGPSYYPFSPAAGAFPGAGGSTANYTSGAVYTMEYKYTIDPNNGKNAFEYAVNGQFGAPSAGDPYFDLSGPIAGSQPSTLGGYFQIGNDPNNPNQAGTAVFSNISITPVTVPEPVSFGMLAIGSLALLGRRRSKI